VDDAAIDRIADRVSRALAAGAPVDAAALRLVVHRFAVTGRDAWRDVLGRALARVADDHAAALAVGAATPGDLGAAPPDPARMLLLAEALAVADDQDLRNLVAAVAARCQAAWPQRGTVASAAGIVDFCLAAGLALTSSSLVAAAVGELERLVSLAYEPGDGVAQLLTTRSRTTGDLATHVAVALALLRAYDASGRTAYPMLAEELMHADAVRAAAPPLGVAALGLAAVLARLAVLQRDPDYRAVAVTRDDGQYAQAAERLLRAFDPESDPPLDVAAAYGLAVEEWLRLA
jgi:hypothetical protein